MNAFTWACEILPVCGMAPDKIFARIFDFFAFTSAYVVNGPPELVLPAAWQLLLMEQTVLRMGLMSAVNAGEIPVQVKVLPPLPGPPPVVVVSELFLHDNANNTHPAASRHITAEFFISEFIL